MVHPLGGASNVGGGYTIHLGSNDSYIALYQRRDHWVDIDYLWEKGLPLNHTGVVVDDITDVESRVVAAGLLPFNHGDYAPGKRFYFLDPDGITLEFACWTKEFTGDEEHVAPKTAADRRVPAAT